MRLRTALVKSAPSIFAPSKLLSINNAFVKLTSEISASVKSVAYAKASLRLAPLRVAFCNLLLLKTAPSKLL